jgi:hypothetical protein
MPANTGKEWETPDKIEEGWRRPALPPTTPEPYNRSAVVKNIDGDQYDFSQRFYQAFSERLRDPSNRSTGLLFGLVKPKSAATNESAIASLGYSDPQKEVIKNMINLKDPSFKSKSPAEIVETLKSVIIQGRAAFPVGDRLPFQRIARFFATGNDKKGFGIIVGGTPMWYIKFMSTQTGGRRRSTGRTARRTSRAHRKGRRSTYRKGSRKAHRKGRRSTNRKGRTFRAHRR